MIGAARIRSAVERLIPEVTRRLEGTSNRRWTEKTLWWDLSVSVLSSQVSFDLAVAAANRIDRSRVLRSGRCRVGALEREIRNLLGARFVVAGRRARYRFPSSKARQLSLAHQTIHAHYGSLTSAVNAMNDPYKARAWLSAEIAGLGPKQASMFLRNAGMTYDLAIIDRHILRYMSLQKMKADERRPPTSLTDYRTHEIALQQHAIELGTTVGVADWAIWIVMRAVKDLQSQ